MVSPTRKAGCARRGSTAAADAAAASAEEETGGLREESGELREDTGGLREATGRFDEATARLRDETERIFAKAEAVADAILYEGYLLYPYRRSSAKNRVRWQFGVLVPRRWAEAQGLTDVSVAGSAESWWQRTECLLSAGPGATVTVRVRFLHLQHRSVRRHGADGRPGSPDGVRADSPLPIDFDEAEPRQYDIEVPVADLLAGERRVELTAPGGVSIQPIVRGGRLAGRIVRRRRPVTATVRLSAEVCATPSRSGNAVETGTAPLVRLRVRVENEGRTGSAGNVEGAGRTGSSGGVESAVSAESAGAPGRADGHGGAGTAARHVSAPGPGEVASGGRDEVLRRSLIATHTLIAVRDGAFVSLLDPPERVESAARACANVHTFPVLAGPEGGRELVFSSPILLYDHPRVAPESPGDLYDATEIDEILSLRTLTLTDAEKREARATDPRAAVILDRVETMPRPVMAGLHGAVRSRRPAGVSPATGHPAAADSAPEAAGQAVHQVSARWSRGAEPGPGGDEGAHVIVGGTRVTKGSRVRLRPRRRGTDPQDVFLNGRTAVVEAVLRDVDGDDHLAVTVEDDPAAELNRWYGRFRYFSPDEIEPLPASPEPGGAASGAPGAVSGADDEPPGPGGDAPGAYGGSGGETSGALGEAPGRGDGEPG